MDNEQTFTHIGTEANQLLMKIAQKSAVYKNKYGQDLPIISPRSNDNIITVNEEMLRTGSKG